MLAFQVTLLKVSLGSTMGTKLGGSGKAAEGVGLSLHAVQRLGEVAQAGDRGP